jgi:cytochrome P450
MNSATTEMSRGASDEYRIPDEIAKIVFDAASYADDDVIYPALKWLREHQPLGLAHVDGYDPIWVVTRHADIMAIERDANLFHNADANPILNSQLNDQFMKKINNGSLRLLSSLTFMDPPEHGLYREITSNWFLPANIRKLEDQIRVVAKESVEKFLSFDRECDFLKDFALFYPLRVVMSLFGVPREDEPRMLKLTQEFFGTQDPDEQRDDVKLEPDVAARMWHATLQDFFGYFNALSAERRKNPTNDLLSLIANTKINGEFIGEAESNGYYVAIATAGHDTTSSSTSGGMLGLIKYPGEMAKVKADPGKIGGLVDESIRWSSPVKHFMRNATADTMVAGQTFKKMDRFMLSFPSANRDEAVFEAPDEFRIERRPNRHLAFGYGAHMCLGQHLAKLEMRILFEELLPKLKSIELNGKPQAVKANFVGGLKSLPVRFVKA